MSTGRAPEFTPRQAAAWPEAVAEVQSYVDTSTVSSDLYSNNWTVEWAEESRPGRGQYFTGIYCDGEYLAHVLMDVYGYPAISVAELTWLHNSMDEECDCQPCKLGTRWSILTEDLATWYRSRPTESEEAATGGRP